MKAAAAEYTEQKIVQDEREKLSDKTRQPVHRFAILIKAGLSSLKYSSDINNLIRDLDPSNIKYFKDLPGHPNIGLEGQYALTHQFKLKLGLAIENLLSQWTVSIDNAVLFQNLYFDREYQFVNTYTGINYIFWRKPESLELYAGSDIGLTTFNS